MKSPSTWFIILAALCIVGPYLMGVAPRRRRHWTYIAITIALLALLLPLMAPLRS